MTLGGSKTGRPAFQQDERVETKCQLAGRLALVDCDPSNNKPKPNEHQAQPYTEGQVTKTKVLLSVHMRMVKMHA